MRNLRGLPLTLPLALALAGGAGAQDDGGFSFEIVEAEVKTEDQAAYDECRRSLNREAYAEALVCYDGLFAKKGMEKYLQDAEYDSAKALYRMGLYHAALSKYAGILERGPEHKYFTNSREWLFFIARRLNDRFAAVELIASYTDQKDIPEQLKNELNYHLARHFFDVAVKLGHEGVAVEGSSDAAAEGEGEGGGDDSLDFGADALEGFEDKKGKKGDAKSDDKASEPTEPKEDKKEEKKKDDFDFSEDDFSFGEEDLGGGDDDGFDFSFDEPDEKKKKAKKGKKPRGKRARDGDKGDKGGGPEPRGEDPATAAAPDESLGDSGESGGEPAADEPEKTHVNANPADAEASMKRALGHVTAVDPSFGLYAKAKYLEGLIQFALGEFEPAVAAFREVVRMTHPKTGTFDNPKLREMAFFSLARIHYQFEQFRYAIFYYERIDRDSEAWLDALFEASWAHFRLGEYEKALGNLVTIQSPFFIDEYYPESHILKAITFYENCRYPEATAFLGEFKARYDGVVAELDRLLEEQKRPEDLYNELKNLEAQVAAGKDDEARSLAITARIVGIALKDKRLAQYRAASDEVEAELAALQSVPAPFAGTDSHTVLVGQVQARRDQLIRDVGKVLQIKLVEERDFLKDLQAKLIRIQFEIAKQQKEGLEAELKGVGQTTPINEYGFTTATDDERVYWPFEGEYWRDELGTYEYTLTRGCRPPERDEE